MRSIKAATVLTFALLLCSCSGVGPPGRTGRAALGSGNWQGEAAGAISDAMADLDVNEGAANLLVLTNAGYGSVNGQSTEVLADIAMHKTGCTMGRGSLLFVHAPESAPLWFALFRRDTHRAVFVKWSEGTFQRQRLDLHPAHVLEPDAWEDAGAGLVGGNLFQVASFCLVWSVEPAWGLLKSAELHNHICPGVNAGYVVAQHIRKDFSLRAGEQYVLVSAPPACPVDAFQTVLDCTAGKHSMFTMKVGEQTLARHSFTDVMPVVIALRVNREADTCDGAVLGFDWRQACTDSEIDRSDFSPPGGSSNPLFFISRARAAWKMADMPMEKKLRWVKPLRRFSGKASLADEVAGAGADPYAALPAGE